MASSLLAIIYVWRMIEVLYMKQPVDATRREAPLSMLIPLWIMALSTIWFGLDTDLTMTAARTAADGLLNGFTMGGTH